MPKHVSKISAFVTMFALTACGEPIQVGLPPPPDAWLSCQELPAKPDLSPLDAITLPDGRQVYLKADVDARDGHIARYIVQVRQSWFDCSNNLEKVRGYYEE